MKVIIAKTELNHRKNPTPPKLREDGSESVYSFFLQQAYLEIPGKMFPEEFEINHGGEDDRGLSPLPFEVGEYEVDMNKCVYLDRNSRIAISTPDLIKEMRDKANKY